MATKVEKAVATEQPIIEDILHQAHIDPENEVYPAAHTGMQLLLRELSSREETPEKIDRTLIDDMIKMLDQRLSEQLDHILQHKKFQELEATWRELKFLLDNTDEHENIKVEIFNASKTELLEDFEDAPDITHSGLYKHVYTEEYGQFGGQPVGAILGNYFFGPGDADVKLLSHMGQLGAISHAPFIAGAGPEFFGLQSFDGLPNLKDVESVFDSPQFAKWNALRETEDARYVGLAMPRFLLREPYSEDSVVRSFNYIESVGDNSEKHLWGNAAFALVTRIHNSFAKYRWCPNIIGPQSGGSIHDLPAHVWEERGQYKSMGPTEIQISDRKEYELSEHGFVPLTLRKDTTNATFFSAPSIQKPKKFGGDPEGRQAELNYHLGTQLPYLFIVNRLAHYIKVLQRENLGSWKTREDIEKELNIWLGQYVSDQENPSPATRSHKPLRKAHITVSESDQQAGWYSVDLKVTPHFKFMGMNFTLSLSGLLDKT